MSCNEGRSDSVRRGARFSSAPRSPRCLRRRRPTRSGRRSRATTRPTSPCRRSASSDRPQWSRGSRTRARRPRTSSRTPSRPRPRTTSRTASPARPPTGWASVDRTQALVPTPTGGLAIAFGGIHSTNSADPLIGLIGATHNADGSWSAPDDDRDRRGHRKHLVGRAERRRADLRRRRRRLDQHPRQPDLAGIEGQRPISLAQLGPATDGYEPKLARRLEGRLWVAWYSSGTANRALRAAARPDDGPANRYARRWRPNEREHRQQLVRHRARLRGDLPPRLRRRAGGTSTNLVVSWWIGEATPTTIANLATRPDRRPCRRRRLPQRRAPLDRVVERQVVQLRAR